MKFRKGHVVRDEDDKILVDAKSINQAKRFMRTGSVGSSPAPVIVSLRNGAYIPKTAR